jgi:DnaJ-domain-containing protein 1
MTAKKKSVIAEVIEVIANSELGHSLNEWARRGLGLPRPVDEGMKAGARQTAENIRKWVKDDPYVILGVDHGADTEVVKAAYKALTKKYHESGTEPNEKMMKRINGAYEAIMKERGQPK